MTYRDYRYYRPVSLGKFLILADDGRRRIVCASEALLRNRGLKPEPAPSGEGERRKRGR